MEENLDTGSVRDEALISDMGERDEQIKRNPKNKNSGNIVSTVAVHDTKGKDTNAGINETACNTGGEKMDTGDPAGQKNLKQKLPKYTYQSEGDYSLPGIEKSPPRHSISPSRIKYTKKQNAVGYIQGSGRAAIREHSLRYRTDIPSIINKPHSDELTQNRHIKYQWAD
jgi:hypothetical protein